jgi:hypothetical protein
VAAILPMSGAMVEELYNRIVRPKPHT